MSINRKEIREALAVLLRGGVTLVPGEDIYAYQVGDFAGKSPVMYLTSSGSRRDRATGMGRRSAFFVNLHVLVLYKSDDAYMEQDAEDLLDRIEAEITGAFTPAGGPGLGFGINWSDRSDADQVVVIGGDTYLHETIPLVVEAL